MYNTPEGGGIEFREYDEAGDATFWQLSQLMDVKATEITQELARVQARANYYQFHESGERNVMIFSIDKWQTHLQSIAFGHWRSNVARARAQRVKLQTIWSNFESRSAKAKSKKCFLLWKYQRVRTQRQLVGPQLVELAAEAKQLETETSETNLWINEATNSLKELTNKLQAFAVEKTQRAGNYTHATNVDAQV
jgi:hypothetical protein